MTGATLSRGLGGEARHLALVAVALALAACGTRTELDDGYATQTTGTTGTGGDAGPPPIHEVVLIGDGPKNEEVTWTFDSTGAWSAFDGPSPTFAGVGFPTLSAAGGNRVVLWGGLGGAAASTWIFDGAWHDANVKSPPPRANPSFANLGDRVVLFGGFDGAHFLNDTWVFDGARWNELAHVSPLMPRERAPMSELDGRLILFGGDFGDSGEVLGDTWAFEGGAWSQLETDGSPPPRTGAVLAKLGDTLVLFGGQDPPNDQFGDTWRFDGDAWREIATSGPPAQSSALAATFDDEILFFGQPQPFGGEPWDITWKFDGNAWSEVAGEGSGPLFTSSEPAMATIAKR